MTLTGFDRLWSRTQQGESGCLVFTGYIDRSNGYGKLTVHRRTKLAHRFSWELTNGPIPDGMFVCHHCDNPPCVNPDHLFLGTAYDNMRDMIAKGRARSPVGIACGNAKLTDQQVREIRMRYRVVHPSRRTGSSASELAAEFGVNRGYVTQLIRGVCRKSAYGAPSHG